MAACLMVFLLLCAIGLTAGWCERQYRWPVGSGLLVVLVALMALQLLGSWG